MARRKLSKAARFERMYKVWEYLRKNTDSAHPITQAKMRKAPEVAEYIGDKETFNRLIKDMARAMNTDESGYKQETDWKIYFHDFKKYYGDHVRSGREEMADDEDDYDDYVDQTMYIGGLYYNRTFSYEEIDSIVEGVLSAGTLDTRSARDLIEKVEDNLTTRFYRRGPGQICKGKEPALADREQLKSNLLTIQKAIDNQVQVSFRLNGYSRQKRLEPVRDYKDTVTPYYIVVNGGQYYLLACKGICVNAEIVKNMSIWRIDLMTELEIPGAKPKDGVAGLPRIPRKEVQNLPKEWREDFQLSHLHMSHDRPECIILRIKGAGKDSETEDRDRVDYTFLHDSFGDSFQYIKTEKKEPFGDIVKVECSPSAMTGWALQYSDRVEVLEPEYVRRDIADRIRELNAVYGLK